MHYSHTDLAHPKSALRLAGDKQLASVDRIKIKSCVSTVILTSGAKRPQKRGCLATARTTSALSKTSLHAGCKRDVWCTSCMALSCLFNVTRAAAMRNAPRITLLLTLDRAVLTVEYECRPALCDTCCLDAEGKSIDGCICDDWTEQCVEFVYQQALITSEAMVAGSIKTDTATCTTTLTDKKTYLVSHLTEPVRACCVSFLCTNRHPSATVRAEGLCFLCTPDNAVSQLLRPIKFAADFRACTYLPKCMRRLHRNVPLQFYEYNMVIDEGANGTSTCAALVAATGFAESVNAQAASGAHLLHSCCAASLTCRQ